MIVYEGKETTATPTPSSITNCLARAGHPMPPRDESHNRVQVPQQERTYRGLAPTIPNFVYADPRESS
ncbi:unnamed protein product [Lota lota]